MKLVLDIAFYVVVALVGLCGLAVTAIVVGAVIAGTRPAIPARPQADDPAVREA